MTNPYGPPQQPYTGQQQWPQQQPPKKRKVWPWVVGAVILIPILMFAGCAALIGGAASSVQDARKGGTVAIGQTFTYQSGLAITASAPKPYTSDNEFTIAAGESGYETSVTVANGTKNPVGATLITMNATVNNGPVERIYDGVAFPTQDIAPGQQLVIPFRFKVKKGTKGPLQIAVTDTFNEPVFFTAKI